MPTNDEVYELVDTMRFEGQTCKNVYFYQSDQLLGSGFDASDLIDAFIDDVIPDIILLQSNQVVHTEISARSLFDATNREVRAVSIPGGGGSVDILPVFTAVGIKLVQNNGAIKNGSKRIPGVHESAQTDGVLTDSGYLANADALATQLATDLTVGLSNIFTPVIVGRILDGSSYRLPETLAESVIGVVVDGVVSALLTSQVSRKIGVGE